MELQSVENLLEFNEDRFTKRIIFKKGDNAVFVLNFLPGQTLPTHTHPRSEVFLLVLQGEGTFVIDGNNVPVKHNDSIHCNGEESLSFINNSESPVTLYVVLNKIPDDRFAQNI